MKYAIAPEGTERDYLTVGKRYGVTGERDGGFYIVSDSGNILYCLYKNCGHLHNGDWIIVDEPDAPAASADIDAAITVRKLNRSINGPSVTLDGDIIIKNAENYSLHLPVTELDWLIAALTKIKGLTNGV